MSEIRRPWSIETHREDRSYYVKDASGMVVLETVEYSGLDYEKLAQEVCDLANGGGLDEELRDRIVAVLRNPRLREVEEARALLEELGSGE